MRKTLRSLLDQMHGQWSEPNAASCCVDPNRSGWRLQKPTAKHSSTTPEESNEESGPEEHFSDPPRSRDHRPGAAAAPAHPGETLRSSATARPRRRPPPPPQRIPCAPREFRGCLASESAAGDSEIHGPVGRNRPPRCCLPEETSIPQHRAHSIRARPSSGKRASPATLSLNQGVALVSDQGSVRLNTDTGAQEHLGHLGCTSAFMHASHATKSPSVQMACTTPS